MVAAAGQPARVTTLKSAGPGATEAVGAALADAAGAGTVIFLSGELGAGKTTLVRGFLRRLGYRGRVKSPTFTLVEPYPVPPLEVFHMDLYRIRAAEELDAVGVRDYFDGRAVCLVEWPEHAGGALGQADLTVEFRIGPGHRELRLLPRGPRGEALAAAAGGA